MMSRLVPYFWLLVIGVSWGATLPLSKISVSTGHGHFGLIFWQTFIAAVLLGTINTLRRRALPLHRRALFFYCAIALIGTVIPNSASYQAIAVLPSGLASLLLSMVPMLAFPIALAMGLDQFRWRRLLGLCLGLAAVTLIVGVPDALPDAAMLVFIPIGMIAPLMYAFEGNFVAKWGRGGTGPLQLMLGASVVGALISGPLAVTSGQWINPMSPWGPAEYALILGSAIHAIVYTLYVTIIGRYGSVFAVQVGYVVTLAGVAWAMLVLAERYTGPIWLALALLLLGVYLVSPKPQDPQ